MAAFFNRATFSYNDVTTSSNTVTGEIVGSLSVNKTAISDCYTAGDRITYVVNIINSGETAFSSLTLTDDLGEYESGGSTFIPLTYVVGSLRAFENGVPTGQVNVQSVSPLTVTEINVPRVGVTTLVYEVTANEFAPLSAGSEITNSVSVSAPILGNVAEATATIRSCSEASLTIEKSLSPSTVSPGGRITYTFTIRNTGNSPVVATDNAVLSDIFEPILTNLYVTYNGALLESPDGYTYNPATGEFNTVQSVITVPAATYVQDPVTGAWTVEPGVAVLTVSGNV